MTEQRLDAPERAPLVAHNRPLNRYRFTGRLRARHALHVGSGRGDASTDALVVADARGAPFIPGSSLRGVFRSQVERLLEGLRAAQRTSLWACQLYEPTLDSGHVCVGNSENPDCKDEYEALLDLQERRGIQAVWSVLPQHLCDSCRLFGAGTFWASKIRFTDLLLEAGGEKQIRHGVGIHRDTGTAAPRIKYDREVVEAGSIFAFEAYGENLEASDLLLLSLGFSQLRAGEWALGGSSGRGLGSCVLENGQVGWVNLSDCDELLTYLTAHTYPHQEPMEALVDKALQSLAGDEAGS